MAGNTPPRRFIDPPFDLPVPALGRVKVDAMSPFAPAAILSAMRQSSSSPRQLWLALAIAAVVGLGQLRAAAQPPPTGLRIIVIEGEDAVNIIQQKTAVAPVVEVRDRNDQPVAGAIVNFAIRSGRASFGGARTLTV